MQQTGLFYTPVQKLKKEPGKRAPAKKRERVIAPIPDTDWQMPTEFPNLSNATYIALDLETKDPELTTCGPGWARGSGHIVGISLAVDEGRKWYFPMRHELGDNMNPEAVLRYMQDTLSNPKQAKVGANLIYDVGWLRQEGVHVAGPLLDTFSAEALIDEWAHVSLNYLAKKYLDSGKKEELLYQWLADSYGGHPTRREQAGRIHLAPAQLVGPYAEDDAALPLQIWAQQYRILQGEGLLKLFELESKLIPLLIDMRFRGVRVDLDAAQRAADEFQAKEDEYQQHIVKLTGSELNVDAATDIAHAFDKLGLPYNSTSTGKPSFTKGWLEAHQHPLAQNIVGVRKMRRARGTFVESFIFDKHVNGRVHCNFVPLKGESGGTVSGRFSSSDPNLQQIPARDKFVGPRARRIYVPDEGHKEWIKVDYSQIELRMFAHFSNDTQIIQAYHQGVDFHDVTSQNLGGQVPRPLIKTLNFLMLYGGGAPALTAQLISMLSVDEAHAVLNELGYTATDEEVYRKLTNVIFSLYTNNFPTAKQLANKLSQQAQAAGEVLTLLNRKARFTKWAERWSKKGSKPLAYEEALEQFGAANIERYGTHKALNRTLQGSAADLMKEAMLQAYEAGVFDVTGVPMLTVHDELDLSNPGTREAEQALQELVHIMENAIQLKVPVVADVERGPSWGEVK